MYCSYYYFRALLSITGTFEFWRDKNLCSGQISRDSMKEVHEGPDEIEKTGHIIVP